MTVRRVLPGVLWTSDQALQIASGFVPQTAAELERYAEKHGAQLHFSLGPEFVGYGWIANSTEPYVPPKVVTIRIERHEIMGCYLWAVGMNEADEKIVSDHFATMQLDTCVSKLGAA